MPQRNTADFTTKTKINSGALKDVPLFLFFGRNNVAEKI